MNAVSSVLENNGLRDVLGLSLSYLDLGDVKEVSQVSRLLLGFTFHIALNFVFLLN